MPPQARWPEILAAASTKDVAKRIDDGLSAIEAENRELRNMLPRVYARAPLSAELLGSLVETIAKIGFGKDPEEARDVLGRTYEYFIKEFARAEGHRTRGFDEAAVARRPPAGGRRTARGADLSEDGGRRSTQDRLTHTAGDGGGGAGGAPIHARGIGRPRNRRGERAGGWRPARHFDPL